MDLEGIQVAIRPRGPWEALDLGFAMARRWFAPLWRLWWVTALPVYVLALALFPEQPWLVVLLSWWFKPFYEPSLLLWISRALFGENPSVREIAKQRRQLTGMQLMANLTWRRFSPNRSFNMPVTLLEGLGGQKRRDRIAVLGKRQQAGSWLTIVGLHFELVLEISFLILVIVALPEELRWVDLETFLLTPGRLDELLHQLAGLLAMSLIAPFYVAAGFALYVARRTELEAWDIELSFRRLASRPVNARTRGAAAGLAVFLAVLLTTTASPRSEALALEPASAHRTIEDVLAHEDFGRIETQSYWRYLGNRDADGDASGWWSTLIDFLQGFEQGIAVLAEASLWAGVGFLIAYLAYRIAASRRWLQVRPAGTGGASTRPARLFGLDLSPQQLPNDLVAAVLRQLEENEPRSALSLLYRGTLARLVDDARLQIPESATEGECRRLVADARPQAESVFFNQLTDLWLALAYGHRIPPEERIRALCRSWRALYGNDGEH